MSLIDTSLRERKRMVVRGSTAYQDSNGNRRIKSAEQMQKISDALNALGIDHTVKPPESGFTSYKFTPFDSYLNWVSNWVPYWNS